jgi:hypothetical protein
VFFTCFVQGTCSLLLCKHRNQSCHSPLAYVSYSLPQAPFVPCASSQFSLACAHHFLETRLTLQIRFFSFTQVGYTLPWRDSCKCQPAFSKSQPAFSKSQPANTKVSRRVSGQRG